jgi:hypothetical protein
MNCLSSHFAVWAISLPFIWSLGINKREYANQRKDDQQRRFGKPFGTGILHHDHKFI